MTEMGENVINVKVFLCCSALKVETTDLKTAEIYHTPFTHCRPFTHAEWLDITTDCFCFLFSFLFSLHFSTPEKNP